ncbi:MAG TPA: phenylalanine--tRNA ligase subunit beta [Syntrophorhabdaceae bacterium]|nr:phenylalanine--tRNA ligase subunit beta [Syntrophorhabdaceae bacterium]HRV23391.1 phenylalanine--tRNA ligase subunit beta [Syntrophorhabdaceae bacterium]
MRVPFEWLKEFVVIDITPQELAYRLTMRGLEVEAIEDRTPCFSGVVVGCIKEITQHPNAENLSLCIVDIGKEEVSVLCGAKNISRGDKVPIALKGASLKDGTKIETRAIRGITSYGMLCSERELGLSEDHSGIFILPGDAIVGRPLDDLPGIRDCIFDINVPPNRGDCMSIYGIAREVASILNQKAKIPIFKMETTSKEKIEDVISLRILDTEACPRYVLRMIRGASIVTSPFWMRDRILKCGMRPINAIVDVTNYVMLELGQPLHAFDYERLNDRRIEVRVAENPIVFRTLDGEDRQLEKGDILICDGKGPVALAGIMGGENSEITDETRIIALESAYFNPMFIRRTSRRIGIKSEASLRFEKGIDLENVDFAAQRAIDLMRQIAGGEILKGNMEVNEAKKKEGIFISFGKINEVLGTTIDHRDVLSALRSIDLHILKEEENGFVVSIPWFRHDISEHMDIVEEVARIYGYENIPVTTPASAMTQLKRGRKNRVINVLKDFLVSAGFFEVINFAFMGRKDIDNFLIPPSDSRSSSVSIINPISKDYGVMRTFMAPNVLKNIAYNINRGIKNIKVFELGKVFISNNENLPEEHLNLFLAMTGKEREYFWREQPGEYDFFDIKGIIEGLAERLGLVFEIKAGKEPFLENNRSADIYIDGKKIGWLGEVREDILRLYEIEQKTYCAEIGCSVILDRGVLDFQYRAIPRYPQAIRDFSFFVDEAVPVARLIESIKNLSPLIVSVGVFDMFKKDKRSVSFRVVFQSFEETLRDETVNAIQQKIIDELTQIEGITLRV